MKKKGSLIIETLVAMMFLIISGSIVLSSVISAEKSLKIRKVKEELSRVSYNIMNEIKYNYTLEEINEILDKGSFKLKYYENFMLDLLKINLIDMEIGDEIEITRVNDNKEDNINKDVSFLYKYRVNITVDVGGFEVNENREFYKSFWMES